MTDKEIKALISLIDDDDVEVSKMVEDKIRSLGSGIVPFLEQEWESNFNPHFQKRLEDIIHDLQIAGVHERLTTWVAEGATDLLEGMWIVATYLYPDVTYENLSHQIEQYYYTIWMQMNDEMTPYEKVKLLNTHFFSQFGFGPNTKNFHSPANSMINVVLDSKRGNPISLCVIYMLLAKRLNMPVYGVNLPNLFVLTYKEPGTQFYINVFNRGVIFTRTDIESYISQLKMAPIDVFFDPCSHLDIVQRVLRNLILSYEKMGEMDRAKEVDGIFRLIKKDTTNDL